MRLVIQRVKEASVKVDEAIIGQIGSGLLVLLGIHRDDQLEETRWLVSKLLNLRIFEDSQGKMNRSLIDTKGEVLVISQFTLYANCNGGRRPDFFEAAPPETAKLIYNQFVEAVRKEVGVVHTGQFGAYMQVSLINDGPVTIVLDAPKTYQDTNL